MSNDGVRIHSSSGTTGNPTVIVHSQHDLDSWANLVARCLYAVGIRKTDVFQNSSGYGMFTGGLGFQYGAERLGCLTVPAAAGNSKRQIKFINDFKTTALHAIPSYAIRLAEVFQEEGLDPKGTTLKTLVIGAEPHTDEQRRKIEKMLGVKAYNSFGMTEMNGPGVAFECQEQNGMHFWEDCYLVEIIDPETGEPVQEGEIGECVYANKKQLKEIRKNFGLVFQNFNLFPHYTVMKNIIDAPVCVDGVSKEEAKERAWKLLKQLGLSDKADAYPYQLSGGQQQRVSIARALALQPKVLFFDEPTSALDPELTGEVLRVIRQLADEHMTMVIVTHEMQFAKELSDRVIFMEKGLVCQEGTPEEVFGNPNARVKEFIGRVMQV